MTVEAGVVVAKDGSPIHWHLPADRSIAYLPDSHDLWTILWDNRENVAGFAHSHPGHGIPSPSWEDITTFAAIEAALGRRLSWWITSADHVISLVWSGPDKHAYSALPIADPSWVWALRVVSGFERARTLPQMVELETMLGPSVLYGQAQGG